MKHYNEVAENVLRRRDEQLLRSVEPYGAVRSTLCSSHRRGDALEVTLFAECVEELGVRVPIYTEVPDESP